MIQSSKYILTFPWLIHRSACITSFSLSSVDKTMRCHWGGKKCWTWNTNLVCMGEFLTVVEFWIRGNEVILMIMLMSQSHPCESLSSMLIIWKALSSSSWWHVYDVARDFVIVYALAANSTICLHACLQFFNFCSTSATFYLPFFKIVIIFCLPPH